MLSVAVLIGAAKNQDFESPASESGRRHRGPLLSRQHLLP